MARFPLDSLKVYFVFSSTVFLFFNSSIALGAPDPAEFCAKLSKSPEVCQETTNSVQERAAALRTQYEVEKAYCYYNQKMWRVFSAEQVTYYSRLAELYADLLPKQLELIKKLQTEFNSYGVSGDVSKRVSLFVDAEVAQAEARLSSLKSAASDAEQRELKFREAEAKSLEEFKYHGAGHENIEGDSQYMSFLERNQSRCSAQLESETRALEQEIVDCRKRFEVNCQRLHSLSGT